MLIFTLCLSYLVIATGTSMGLIELFNRKKLFTDKSLKLGILGGLLSPILIPLCLLASPGYGIIKLLKWYDNKSKEINDIPVNKEEKNLQLEDKSFDKKKVKIKNDTRYVAGVILMAKVKYSPYLEYKNKTNLAKAILDTCIRYHGIYSYSPLPDVSYIKVPVDINSINIDKIECINVNDEKRWVIPLRFITPLLKEKKFIHKYFFKNKFTVKSINYISMSNNTVDIIDNEISSILEKNINVVSDHICIDFITHKTRFIYSYDKEGKDLVEDFSSSLYKINEEPINDDQRIIGIKTKISINNYNFMTIPAIVFSTLSRIKLFDRVNFRYKTIDIEKRDLDGKFNGTDYIIDIYFDKKINYTYKEFKETFGSLSFVKFDRYRLIDNSYIDFEALELLTEDLKPTIDNEPIEIDVSARSNIKFEDFTSITSSLADNLEHEEQGF